MKVNKCFIVILILLTGFCNKSFTQDTEPVPLVNFLMYLENRFDVVFSFADANIAGISVKIAEEDLSLDDYLLELEKQTGLNFKKVNSRYIAIQKISKNVRVSGIIIDGSTKEKLVGAVIYSGEKHAVSNENGFFSLVLNQKDDLEFTIRHVGYKPLRVNQDSWNTGHSVYKLEMDIQELEEVKLHYISRAIDKIDDGSVQLNVPKLEVLPGLAEPDVLQVIQILPGIHSANEAISDINTRGGTNDQTLVLWDGVKMYQSGHFFGLVSAFNSHLINETKIIKNGTSAYYDEGISGTIDMRQQNYLVEDFEVSAGLNMLSADIIAKIPFSKKLSLILGGRHSINNIVRTPTYESYYKRAFEHTEVMLTRPGTDTTVDTYRDFSFYDLSAKLLYNISESDQIRLSILNNQNSIDYKESATIRDTIYTRESYLGQSNSLARVAYHRTWSEYHTTQLSAFVSHYLLDGSNVSIRDNQNHLQENEVLDWGIKFESKSSMARNIELISGYQFKEIGIRNLDNIRKPNYTRDVKDVLRIFSLYTEIEFKELFQKIYFRTGFRTNYFSKFNSYSLEPRVALTYRINRYLSLEALAENKSQHTTQLIDFQSDFLGIEKRRWVLSNDESVPVLKSQQYSMGIQYNRNQFLISLEGYRKKINGIITPSQGFQNQYQYIFSTGEYEARGAELLVNKRFKSSTTWLTYSLAKNDYYFEEFTPSVFPNNLDIRHAVSLGGSYTRKNFEVSAGFNYHTGKPYTQPARDSVNERNEIVYKEANSSRLRDYMRLDISARYSFVIKEVKAELGVSIWNILNRQNVYNVYYLVNDNNEIEQIIQNTLGFTPNLGLRVRF